MTSMTVNGEALHYKLDPETPLLWALRDASNLTGTKYGCDSRDCGACTVIVDGRAVMSCSVTIAALEGADVTTIEGLSQGRAHPVQQAWAAEQVTQCGFCDPGFIMAIAALLKTSPRPSGEEIDAIPNLCPCGATPRIRKAIARAAEAMAPAASTTANAVNTPAQPFSGASPQGAEKATLTGLR
ncbi:MAG: (2Fe-2S)-binding protein [Sphingomicrobium sp.]|nr:(2Fe-2S)-binding protein [Sphingomonadales bacterium]